MPFDDLAMLPTDAGILCPLRRPHCVLVRPLCRHSAFIDNVWFDDDDEVFWALRRRVVTCCRVLACRWPVALTVLDAASATRGVAWQLFNRHFIAALFSSDSYCIYLLDTFNDDVIGMFWCSDSWQLMIYEHRVAVMTFSCYCRLFLIFVLSVLPVFSVYTVWYWPTMLRYHWLNIVRDHIDCDASLLPYRCCDVLPVPTPV